MLHCDKFKEESSFPGRSKMVLMQQDKSTTEDILLNNCIEQIACVCACQREQFYHSRLSRE